MFIYFENIIINCNHIESIEDNTYEGSDATTLITMTSGRTHVYKGSKEDIAKFLEDSKK